MTIPPRRHAEIERSGYIPDADSGARPDQRDRSRFYLALVCAAYLVLSVVFGRASLDVDELGFYKESYELVGGDYTRQYLAAGEFGNAARTVLRSYYFYWKYRPLFAPIIDEDDRTLFRQEAVRFNYAPPADSGAMNGLVAQAGQLVVPDPDRFYGHGAGKPLLSPLLSIPQVWLTMLLAPDRPSRMDFQRTRDYHLAFVATRLVQVLAGLATILIVWHILADEYDAVRALVGALLVALFPLSVVWFPNLHHDAILAPFTLLTAYFFYRQRYLAAGVCFGLALATKNVAVFLAPVFLAYIVWDACEVHGVGLRSARRSLVAGLRGWALTMLVGGVVLLPFADPASYAREVATPLTRRAFDPRGEDVSRFTIAERLQTATARPGAPSLRSTIRPAVRAVDSAFGFQEMWFMFAALGGLHLFSRRNRPLARMCLLVLAISVPLGLVLGHDLNYRMLMFIPFFAILAVDIGRPRPLLCLLAVLVLIDLVYATDPMTATPIHLPLNKRALINGP